MVKKELTLSSFSLKQLSEKIKNGDLSPVDLLESCLYKTKKLNPILNAFITIIEEEDLYKKAEIAEKEIRQGNYRSPLHGIPFSIKDIFYVRGVKCTAGSKILANYIPSTNATAVERMKKAGAILIGTNNLNEFASGITGVNHFYGSTKNPWDISKISGGSSGGSAVAVSTGMVIFSLGTDTGGSIRVPSSLCGVVGLKPTYGRISKHGVFPLSASWDHVGCITRSTWDAAAVLQYISGLDPLDEFSEDKEVPAYTKIIEKSNPKGIGVGIPKNFFCDYLHPEVQDLFYDFIEFLISTQGIIVFNFDLSNTEKFYKSWQDVRLTEAANIHQVWLNTKSDKYSEEVRQMLVQGTRIPAVDYIHSRDIVREIKKEFLSILNQQIEAIIVPTTIIPAPTFEEKRVSIDKNTVLETRQALLRNTIVFNSTGLPAISIPIGLTKHHLPVGAQIIGRPFKEEMILSIAYSYEGLNNSMNKYIPNLAATNKNKV
jgi:aspartyl-tRNA(Asn)/glutamyl-tRNA(Gln) amidotransferase subunit A